MREQDLLDVRLMPYDEREPDGPTLLYMYVAIRDRNVAPAREAFEWFKENGIPTTLLRNSDSVRIYSEPVTDPDLILLFKMKWLP